MPAGISEADIQAQIPQDTGTRGVANRERDPVVVSFPSGHFDLATLTVRLAVEAKRKKAQVSVLDALGSAGCVRARGDRRVQAFQLPPKTYAVQATTTTPKGLSGSATAPIELYEDQPVTIELLPRGTKPVGRSFPQPEGTPVTEPIGLDTATRDSSPRSLGPRSRSNRKTPSPWPRSWTRLVRCARSSGRAKQLTSSPGSTTSGTSAPTRRATPIRSADRRRVGAGVAEASTAGLAGGGTGLGDGRTRPRRLPHHGRRRYCLGAPRHGRDGRTGEVPSRRRAGGHGHRDRAR